MVEQYQRVGLETIRDIVHATEKSHIEYPVDNRGMIDVLGFGFSYIEHEDEVVTYVVMTPKIMKQAFVEVPDAKVTVCNGSIGQLWTAKLLVTDKIKDDHIYFSNEDHTKVLDLDVNRRNPNAYL